MIMVVVIVINNNRLLIKQKLLNQESNIKLAPRYGISIVTSKEFKNSNFFWWIKNSNYIRTKNNKYKRIGNNKLPMQKDEKGGNYGHAFHKLSKSNLENIDVLINHI